MKLLRFTNFFKFATSDFLRPALPVRNGGTKTIPRADIENYIERFALAEAIQNEKNNKPLTRSVEALRKAVQENPVLRACFEGGLNSIPPNGILHGKSALNVLYMMNSIATKPPEFRNAAIIGVPFYAIFIDFMDTRFGQAFFANSITNLHLKQIFNDYQIMLNSERSLYHMNTSANGWLCEEANKRAHYQDYYIDKSDRHWGFKSWNDWFTRRIKPSARPINSQVNSIVHSSDSYPLYYPPSSEGKNPTKVLKPTDQFWLKDCTYSLHDMLGSAQMGIKKLVQDHFVGGTIYQAFLDPWCYHRWHAPISGTIIKSYQLGGTYYLNNPSLPPNLPIHPDNPHSKNYINSQPFLSVVSVRQIFIIQMARLDVKKEENRLVAVIQIGMAEVSGCNPTVIEGQMVNKGDQLGFFSFGGSSYAMIFDKGFNLEFNKASLALNCKDDDGAPATCKQHVNSLLATFTPLTQ